MTAEWQKKQKKQTNSCQPDLCCKVIMLYSHSYSLFYIPMQISLEWVLLTSPPLNHTSPGTEGHSVDQRPPLRGFLRRGAAKSPDKSPLSVRPGWSNQNSGGGGGEGGGGGGSGGGVSTDGVLSQSWPTHSAGVCLVPDPLPRHPRPQLFPGFDFFFLFFFFFIFIFLVSFKWPSIKKANKWNAIFSFPASTVYNFLLWIL